MNPLIRRFLSVSVAVLALLLLVPTAGGQQPLSGPVQPIDLGVFGGPYSRAFSVNDKGQVVGYSDICGALNCGPGDFPGQHPFLWDHASGMTDLGVLAGRFGMANAINNRGHVVGWTDTTSDTNRPHRHAFLWTAEAGMTDMGVLGGTADWTYSEATDINDAGEVVGLSSTPSGESRAFFWTEADGMFDLGTPAGVSISFSRAFAVNSRGDVVGQFTTRDGSGRGFFWTRSEGMVDLGTLGGAYTDVVALNDKGQVVGSSLTSDGYVHAFVWTLHGGFVDLGTLGGAMSRAAAINNAGQVAGVAQVSSGELHAFVWSPATGMVDIGFLNKIPFFGGSVSSISDSGLVAGSRMTGTGEVPFVWSAQTGITDLLTLGGTYARVVAMNDRGQAVGYSRLLGNLDEHGVLWEVLTVDHTPPTVSCDSPEGRWFGLNVTIVCHSQDLESGLRDPADAEFVLHTMIPEDSETRNASTGRREVCDNAGNCAMAGPVGGIMVDRRPPRVAVQAPLDGATLTLGDVVVADYKCTDDGAGVAACAGTVPNGKAIPTAVVGPLQFAVTAADVVGNTTIAQASYSVAYAVRLLYDPAKVHKSGSTVPIKLQLCTSGGQNVSSSAVTLTANGVYKVSSSPVGALEHAGKTNPYSVFRYSPDLAGYIFNLSLKGFSQGTYELTFGAAGDQTVHAVRFQVR